jgi:hypothetical protein
MVFLSQRQSLFAGLLVVGLFAPAGTIAYARGGGFSGGFHGGSSMGAIQSHPAEMPSLTPRASLAPAPMSPMAHAGSTAQSGAMQMGRGDHHHHRPPPGSGTGTSGATDSSLDQSTSAPTQTQVPSPPVNTGRNPALTGGTDPAIGQPSPPVPDTFASSGGSAPVDHSGGGGNTLASCMGFWDSSTHMTRTEWRQTCVRTLNGIDLPTEMGGQPAPSSGGAQHAATRATSTRHASAHTPRR